MIDVKLYERNYAYIRAARFDAALSDDVTHLGGWTRSLFI